VEKGSVLASHLQLGDRTLDCEGNPELLFAENESNACRLSGQANPSPYVKDVERTRRIIRHMAEAKAAKKVSERVAA
jgi:hypothetical protein